jgi:long-subunit fatty acid transport protein
MEKEFKVGKTYRIEVSHKFEGVFSHYDTEKGVKIAVFTQPGANRYGRNVRVVPVVNVISAELMKNGTVEKD